MKLNEVVDLTYYKSLPLEKQLAALDRKETVLDHELKLLKKEKERIELPGVVKHFLSSKEPDYDQYDYMKVVGTYFYVNKNRPDVIKHLQHMEKRHKSIISDLGKVRKEISAVKRKKLNQRIEKLPSEVTPSVDLKNIPRRIRIGKRSVVNNPYYETDDPYAGSGLDFKFSPSQQIIFDSLRVALARNGLPGFSVVYAGWREHSAGRGLSVLAIAANGNLVWKRKGYAQMPSNDIYINGVKINPTASQFARMSDLEQDKYLSQIL